MSTDHTGETAPDDQRIDTVLDQAIDTLASWIIADEDGLDPDVCEQWLDRTYDMLRERLNPEDRIAAIVDLSVQEARYRAHEIRRGMQS